MVVSSRKANTASVPALLWIYRQEATEHSSSKLELSRLAVRSEKLKPNSRRRAPSPNLWETPFLSLNNFSWVVGSKLSEKGQAHNKIRPKSRTLVAHTFTPLIPAVRMQT